MFQGRIGYLKEVRMEVSNMHERLMSQGCFKEVGRMLHLMFQRSVSEGLKGNFMFLRL